MFALFYGACSFNADLSKWDVSRVTTLRSMFGEASKFNGDLSTWQFPLVRDMGKMFNSEYNSCNNYLHPLSWTAAMSFNSDISNW